MKFLPSFTFLLFLSSLLFGQEVGVLPKDETGKYTFYEVVSPVNGISKDSLTARMLDFITKNKKELKLKSGSEASTVTANGKIVITKSLAMLSRPSGEITYRFTFEVNAQKYRFWLTDFEFIPYQKDRYGNFVPSTTVGIPLEKETKKSIAAQWEDYRLQASKYSSAFAARLKDHLANKPQAAPAVTEKKVISKTWR